MAWFEQFFIEPFKKNCSDEAFPGHSFCWFLAGTYKITFWLHWAAWIIKIRSETLEGFFEVFLGVPGTAPFYFFFLYLFLCLIQSNLVWMHSYGYLITKLSLIPYFGWVWIKKLSNFGDLLIRFNAKLINAFFLNKDKK